MDNMTEPVSEWVGTPNYHATRDDRSIIAIVNHITAGSYPGCLSWLQNPTSQASAHYLVTRDGQILQLVKEGDTAWHAGIVNHQNWSLYDGTNPNRYTIGIEHEGMPEDGLTEEQYQATLALHKYLVAKYGLVINRDTIIGHYRIDSVNRPNCPGPEFPWERLFKDLQEGEIKVEHAIVYFTDRDFSSARIVSDKLGGCAMFCRNGDNSKIHPDAKTAKHLVMIGGSEYHDHPNVTNRCGAGAPETAILAAQYAQTL